MKRGHSSYKKALQYLYGLQKYGIKFGLNKTSNLMKAFGDPHKGQAYIHIAGSNGKGSVSAMMESILRKSGLKVGFYSSPHLVRFTERIRINGEEIPPEKVATLTEELISMMDPSDPPTFFEVTTAMALIYFSREKTDVAIVEVGMGGRLDATNIIRPLVSVITNISLEHQFFLGRRLVDIAGEKGGIIKPGVDLVTGATQPNVLRLFQSLCKGKKAPFWKVGKDFRYRTKGSRVSYYGLKRRFQDIEIGLLGRFQARNAAIALGTTEIMEKKGITISSRDVVDGLRDTNWPGRMHIVSREPIIILDGAHNPAAIGRLADSVRHVYHYRRLILVMGVMADKDIPGIIREIIPIADRVIFTRPAYPRAAEPEVLMKAAEEYDKPATVIPTIPEALDRAKELSDAEDLILVCGSLFTVGEALTYFYPERYRPDEIEIEKP
ncbi:MAG: folylpolyglutamate synthase/dihydrofolate synthase family protein [Pseudomonadota bacterium]